MSSIKEEQEREFSYIRKVSCIHMRKFPLALYKQHSTTQLVGHRNRHCNAFVPLSEERTDGETDVLLFANQRSAAFFTVSEAEDEAANQLGEREE